MSRRLTIQYLREQHQAGLIQGFEVKAGESIPVLKTGARIALNEEEKELAKKVKKRGDKIKNWIDMNLREWCKANKYHLLTEQRFDQVRRWKFDWMVCGLVVAIEYEGLASKRNGHTSKKGYSDNTEKYSQANIQGIKLLRYTYLNYNNLFKDLEKLKK